MAAVLSGPLLFPALALIFILAVVLLALRLRRAQPRQPANARRLLTRLLKLSGFALIALLLAVTALMVVIDYRTMKAETAAVPRSVELPPGLPFAVEEVTFSGDDQIRLTGWYIPPANGATIILLHGYGGTRSDMLWHAKTLVGAGYGVLMYDERASGESEGLRRSYGWEDGPDVGEAVRLIQARSGGQAKIGVCGCSIGGQIALQGAILYPEIAAVWADGPAGITAADIPRPENALMGVVTASNVLLDVMYKLELGISPPAPLVDRLHIIAPRPVMLVGGGTAVALLGSEAARIQNFARHAGPNTQTWIIENAVHCDGPQKQPEAYAGRLVAFFDHAFAASP